MPDNYSSNDGSQRVDPQRIRQQDRGYVREGRSVNNGSYPRRKNTDSPARSSRQPSARRPRSNSSQRRRDDETLRRPERSRRPSNPSGKEPKGDRSKLIKIIVAIVVAVIIILLVFKGCTSCSADNSQNAINTEATQAATTANTDATQAASTTETSAEEPADTAVPDRNVLADIIGDELADQLMAEAATNEDLYWIAAHPDLFEPEDSYLQSKLLRLATTDPAAVSFVRGYPECRPADSAVGTKESSIFNDTRVPHLYQWDQRWGYTTYCSTGFGLTGCNPTALAMVYQGLTGKTDVSPYDMGLLAQELGYMDEYTGTPYTFLYAAAEHYGFNCWAIDGDADVIRETLQSGCIIICNVDTGYFTRGNGHYIVLASVDSAGNIVINDPYSSVNSSQSFEPDFLIGEAKGFYAFSL